MWHIKLYVFKVTKYKSRVIFFKLTICFERRVVGNNCWMLDI